MEKTIYDKLLKIKDSDVVSFHMPGHKYGRIYDELGYGEIIREIFSLDTTEIIGTDNLLNAKGIIKKSQENAKKVLFPEYDSGDLELKYLVNGSTCGIESAITASCTPGSKLIINRACHQSAYNACILTNVTPVFVKENIDYKNGVFFGAAPDNYIKKIEENPEAKAVFITRPTYHGMSFKIEKIIKKAHEYGMIVIVDEAHGAHFNLNEKFPKSAVKMGADIVITSIHKTLPSLTQTSVMLIQNNLVNRKKLKKTLSIFESSSPSYILMMSLEICFDIYEKYGKELMDRLLNNIYIFNRNLKNYSILETSDPTKIFIKTIDKGINGYDFSKLLRYEYNIQVELANYSGILMLCTIGNIKSDFDKMMGALNDIQNRKIFGLEVDFFENELDKDDTIRGKKIKSLSKSSRLEIILPIEIPKAIKSPCEAFYSDMESVKIEESLGRVSGEFVTPYPPGISIIVPGEEINQDVIDFLKSARTLKIDVNGMESSNFEYIKVLKRT